LQSNGSYPTARTKFDVGQVWDLTFEPAENVIPPHVEDVLVKRWKQLDPEPDLRSVLLQCTKPWEGSPDHLFDGFLRRVMYADNTFVSERHHVPHMSMGYWLPDAPIIKWHDKGKILCYRYYAKERKLITDYTDFTTPIFKLPEQTLIHVALRLWWTPSNDLAVDASSRVERRCYLYIAGWYM
jgi:hypothetical protein